MKIWATTILLLGVGACGSMPSVPRQQSLQELRTAIESQVTSPEASAQSSRLVDRIADDDVLQNMRRFEVEEAIGRGDTCSRHPRCAEQDFDSNAWFYSVGEANDGYAGPVPELIVGFSREGRVNRVWNLRTHE
jgi:Na+-translocating ferredoxin:NAD+ oxidoreductase RnfG subunit